jgi:CheY-like chemotaxis protein
MLRPIFDVFTQVEESLRVQGGLGLGLKLVKDLVAMHGGTVEALSDGPNLGSEFVVRLPAIPAETPRVAAPPEETFAASPSRHILVVDDGDDNRESMALVLRMVGHSVTTAENGITAVEVALRTLPDAALIDIGLPDLNGYQVAERIRASPRGAGIFLIALTGYGQDEDKQHAISAGFDAHLTKPADLHALDKLLKTLPSAKRPD